MSKLNLVCLGYYVMWRDKACICFKNHGATIEFHVWCSNKTNTFLLRFDYTYSEIYNWKKKPLKRDTLRLIFQINIAWAIAVFVKLPKSS